MLLRLLMLAELFILGAFLTEWREPSSLLRDLSSDAIEVRDSAARELYRRGEELRGILIDARLTAGDPEIRERLSMILRRLDADDRIRWFGGANRVRGFGASLRSDRFFGTGPFRLTVEIMNLAATDRELRAISTWEQDLPDQEVRATAAEARLQVKKFTSSHGLRRTTWHNGNGVPASTILLRPGECARFEVTLEAGSLPPGDYDATVEYFARDLVAGAEENLRTNTVRLKIRK